MPAPRASFGWWAALVLVLAASAVARLSFVARTSPYALHEDEVYLARPAAQMLHERRLDPHFFQYPSLPIYLTAGAFALGHALDGDHEEHMLLEISCGADGCNFELVPDPSGPDVGELRPYYGRPAVVNVARVLFVLLGVAAMVFAGIAGWRAFGSPALLVLAPLCLCASERFLVQSWAYLNVDVVGAFVCTGAIAYLFATLERESFLHRVVVPGLLTGCAVGSKYYLGLVGLPFALVLALDAKRSSGTRAGRILALGAFTVLGFLLTTPYALLDRETFVREVSFELAHYGGGHRGGGGAFDGEPGLEQLRWHVAEIGSEFGAALLVLAGIGMAAALVRSQQRALLFLSFPLVLIVFLCTQRVHFSRNLTSLYALLPVLSALGVVELARLVTRPLAKRLPPRAASAVAGALVLALVAAALPWKRLVRTYSVPVDSRTQALRWIAENTPSDRDVVIAAELALDARSIGNRALVRSLPEFVVSIERDYFGASDPVFVMPKLVSGTQAAAEHAGAAAAIAELEERAAFGANGIQRSGDRPIHMGNPRLSILEPQRPSAARR